MVTWGHFGLDGINTLVKKHDMKSAFLIKSSHLILKLVSTETFMTKMTKICHFSSQL